MKLRELAILWTEGDLTDEEKAIGQIKEIGEFPKEELEEIYSYFPEYISLKEKTFEELKQMEDEGTISEREKVAAVMLVSLKRLIANMEEKKLDKIKFETYGKELYIVIIKGLASMIHIYLRDKDENALSILKENLGVKEEKKPEIEIPGQKQSNIEAMNDLVNIRMKNDDEKIELLEIEDLKNLESIVHPYAKSLEKDEDAIKALAEDIKKNGIISPVIVRKVKGGMYEILSGHRRTKAAKLAKLDYIPCIIKEKISDEEAICIITDNENQRKDILPSERAKAFKLRKEIFDKNFAASMKLAKNESEENAEISTENEGENSGSTEWTEENEGGKRWRDTEEGKQMLASLGVERMTFYNYIKLNDLIDELLDMVDDKKVPIKVAVQLSKLDKTLQEFMASYLQKEKLSEKEAAVLAKEQQTLLNYNDTQSLSVASVKILIKNNLEDENEKPKKAKINMTKIFGEIRKECNSFKGDDKKRFAKISEERFREITKKAVMEAIEKELYEIAVNEIKQRHETKEV